MTTTALIIAVLFIGIIATGVMDLWAFFQRRIVGIHTLDYALVGRWLGLMRRGQFQHQSIISAPTIRYERLLGWLAHYAIGIIFTMILVAIVGPAWLRQPTLMPALMAGVISVAAPWLIMQPAFGLGIAAARTPSPRQARWRSVLTHTVFGCGLYAAAVLFNFFRPLL
ncbi:DUF2938 domain-containing protein [Serratia sp. NPDC078593]|uniref:DUF2938 domain-containing protein n=1 Tax=unclassified Serratia (in: enterobacteria) TaxID=2647522 RepID=UPI0037D012BB